MIGILRNLKHSFKMPKRHQMPFLTLSSLAPHASNRSLLGASSTPFGIVH